MTYEELQTENADLHALTDRLSHLLTGVANALKGPPGPLSSHSWHDLPEVAQEVMRRLEDHTFVNLILPKVDKALP